MPRANLKLLRGSLLAGVALAMMTPPAFADSRAQRNAQANYGLSMIPEHQAATDTATAPLVTTNNPASDPANGATGGAFGAASTAAPATTLMLDSQYPAPAVGAVPAPAPVVQAATAVAKNVVVMPAAPPLASMPAVEVAARPAPLPETQPAVAEVAPAAAAKPSATVAASAPPGRLPDLPDPPRQDLRQELWQQWSDKYTLLQNENIALHEKLQTVQQDSLADIRIDSVAAIENDSLRNRIAELEHEVDNLRGKQHKADANKPPVPPAGSPPASSVTPPATGDMDSAKLDGSSPLSRIHP